MSERLGILTISPSLLKERLGLPEDCTIFDSKLSFERGCVLLKISHPELEIVAPGNVIPIVTIERNDDGSFEGWSA